MSRDRINCATSYTDNRFRSLFLPALLVVCFPFLFLVLIAFSVRGLDGSLKIAPRCPRLQCICTPRTKRAALLQCCRMASRSTTKSCKSAGLQQPQILAAVESPLTAINSAFAVVQKIPESRSALQSGCKVASKRQRMLLPVMAYHSLVQKKEMQAPIIQ